jgi:TonB-linked SusC/RagA family outer membrane protein
MKYFFCVIILSMTLCSYAQIPNKNKDSLNRQSQVLDSVVVFNTGYQGVAKNRATGSFSHVDNKTLNMQTGSNILSRLEAVVPAVAINRRGNSAIPAISVRGLSTITGPTAPLIILDNFPYEGDINSINPNMIESITLLKDATAASIWGVRAGNGVIVINTKKGKAGQTITELSVGVQAMPKPDIFYQKTISSANYIDVEQFLFSKAYYTSQLTSFNHVSISPVVEILDRQAKGLISQADASAQINALKNNDIKDEYYNRMYQVAVNSQYHLQFSGGTTNNSWIAAGGYDRNNSSLDAKYERISARFENSFRPLTNLRINSSVYYVKTKTKNGKPDYTDQAYLYPYSKIYDDNGNALAVGTTYRIGFIDTFKNGKLLDWKFYPGDDYRHNSSVNNTDNLVLNTGLSYQLGHGFSVEGRYQYEKQQGQVNILKDIQSYDTRSLINSWSQVNAQTGKVTYIIPLGGILDQTNSSLNVFNTRGQLNFNRSWKTHQLIALAGAESRIVHTQGQAYRTYGYDPENIYGTGVDYRNMYPTIVTGGNAFIPYQNDFTDQTRKFISFFGNAAYTYLGKYTFTASGRRDASNLFGTSTNNKWRPLWSAGLSWDISKEHFYHSDKFAYLKLRATYGYTGNTDPRRNAVVTVFNAGNTINSGLPYAFIQQFPNPSLSWEKVGITNIGLDLSTKNNRLSGSLEWYTKKGSNLLSRTPVDITTGLGAPTVIMNVADMKGTGIDLTLNSVNIKGRLSWTTGFIFSYNTDKVTNAYVANANGSAFLSDGDNISVVVGKPLHGVYSYRWAGLDPLTGDPLGYLKDKVSKDYTSITGTGSTFDDIEYNGRLTPTYFGSVLNSAAFKNFELQVNINYKAGYVFKRPGLSYGALFAGTAKKSTDNFSRRWQQPGDEAFTDIPSMIYPLNSARDALYNGSSVLVEKGDHIRLQFINLSYTASFKKKGAAPLTLRFFASGNNLGIIWRANKYGLDPDYGTAEIPASRVYAIGIKLSIQ